VFFIHSIGTNKEDTCFHRWHIFTRLTLYLAELQFYYATVNIKTVPGRYYSVTFWENIPVVISVEVCYINVIVNAHTLQNVVNTHI